MQWRLPAIAAALLIGCPGWGEAAYNDWPSYNNTLTSDRFATLDAIDSKSVAGLKVRCSFDTGEQVSFQSGLIEVEGALFATTEHDTISIDANTCKQNWRAQGDFAAGVLKVNRGAAYLVGRVFRGMSDGHVVAYAANNGKLVWSTAIADPARGESVPASPIAWNGLVFIGNAGGANKGVKGRMYALDAKTGHIVWEFYMVPKAPDDVSRGPQAAAAAAAAAQGSWKNGNGIPITGGANWTSYSLDPVTGLLYVPGGNPAPDFAKAVRPGDNLFASSIVVLDAKTGAYRWHYQQVHHDLWDYDSGNPVVLFDLTIDGTPRKGIAEASKSGWVYILDRTTGKPLVGIDERPVAQEPRQATSPTQPIPRGDAFVPQSIDVVPEGYTLVNGGRVFTPYWTDYVIAKPGITGGANWPPSSYDPASGYFYVCAGDRAGVFRAWEITADRPAEGAEYIGGNFGAHTIPGLGTFTAIDLHTNKIAWQQQWSEACYSGSLATAGGLVFVGRNDGRLTALDSSNGKKLWEFQTGAGMNATASAFEHNGKQYVVAYSGGSVFARSAKGDGVWLFALDGTLDPVPAGKP